MKAAVLPILVLVLALTLTSIPATAESATAGVKGTEELTKQEGVFGVTLIHREADFSHYNRLYPTTVTLKFRDRSRGGADAATGSMIRKRKKVSGAPDSEVRDSIKQIILDALVNEVEHNQAFDLAEAAGPDTLLLRVAVVDILAKTPPKAVRKAGVDGPLVAEGTIVFDLIDAETGVIQARVGERRIIQHVDDTVGPVDAETLWAHVREWAARAAADLCLELERARHEGETT